MVQHIPITMSPMIFSSEGEASVQLTEHFSLEEFTRSETAIREGLENTPNSEAIQNLRALCRNVLEPVRAMVKQPLQISSGYRSPQLNAAVGGVPNSQHIDGKAADMVCLPIGALALFKAIVRSAIVFDQLIFEGDWVHVSYDAVGNRQAILWAVFLENQPTYFQLTRSGALTMDHAKEQRRMNRKFVLEALRAEAGTWGGNPAAAARVQEYCSNPIGADSGTFIFVGSLKLRNQFYVGDLDRPNVLERVSLWAAVTRKIGRLKATDPGGWDGSTLVMQLQEIAEEAP